MVIQSKPENSLNVRTLTEILHDLTTVHQQVGTQQIPLLIPIKPVPFSALQPLNPAIKHCPGPHFGENRADPFRVWPSRAGLKRGCCWCCCVAGTIRVKQQPCSTIISVLESAKRKAKTTNKYLKLFKPVWSTDSREKTRETNQPECRSRKVNGCKD